MGKKRWYIAMSTFNWFAGIKVKSAEVKEDANWDSYIYFDTEKKANEFLEKLTKFIDQEYPDLKQRQLLKVEFNHEN